MAGDSNVFLPYVKDDQTVETFSFVFDSCITSSLRGESLTRYRCLQSGLLLSGTVCNNDTAAGLQQKLFSPLTSYKSQLVLIKNKNTVKVNGTGGEFHFLSQAGQAWPVFIQRMRMCSEVYLHPG